MCRKSFENHLASISSDIADIPPAFTLLILADHISLDPILAAVSLKTRPLTLVELFFKNSRAINPPIDNPTNKIFLISNFDINNLRSFANIDIEMLFSIFVDKP